MDRTIIVPYRAEEKELSHILYNAIHGLTLLHPPSEDLKKCLSDEMFIKPNQQAFFHVMAYLFRILDAQEFKKRFLWPITDKRSESNFRTSTVEYLKHLNEKYQQNWSNIKSYLVVMPGGMKFISFLMDFVNFIVQELIKQKEKQLNIDSAQQRDHISEANLQKMCEKAAIFKEMASNFLESIECVNNKYDEKYQVLLQQLDKLSHECGSSVDLLVDEKYLEDFEKSNSLLFNRQYAERTQKVLAMDELIGELKEAMDKFYSKETGYKYDKQRICLQLRRIHDNYPIKEIVEESFATKITDDGVNINTLITTFNGIHETIQNELKVVNKRPCAGEFVYSRLLSLKQNLLEMETQITDFKKMLHANLKKSKPEYPHTPLRPTMAGPKKRPLENTLLMKLVSTPPIKFEVPEGGGKSRLALVDSKTANTNETTFNNFLAPPCTIRQTTNRHHSIFEQSMTDLNNTMSRSKIIDPMQLSRSTSKKDSSKYIQSTPKLNISNLGSKLKQQQPLFRDNEDEHPVASSSANTIEINDSSPMSYIKQKNMNKTSPQSFTKTATPTMIQHNSPFTPFNSNDHTRIARAQYQLLDNSGSALGNISTSLNYVKKMSAVKKVQDASLHLTNLSTSPSGRLEPLVTAEELNIPKLQLNDMTLVEHNLSLNNSMVFEKPKYLFNSSLNSNTSYVIAENDENNAKAANEVQKPLSIQSSEKCEKHLEEDALFDVSDSVLKDVTP